MLKRFKIGGIHPNDNKLSSGIAIEQMPIPNSVTILLSQHIGAPAVVSVNKGDSIKTGDIIAKSGGFISANIHSSVSGVVKSVDPVKDGSGFVKGAVTIEVNDDLWSDSIDRSDKLIEDITIEGKEILQKITDAGIVGLGGATFPAHVKLMIPNGKKAKTLVINGVECEPYLTADHRLMLERSSEIIVGIRLLCKTIDVSSAYIGIENNKKDAIEKMTEAALRCKDINITVVPLKVQYPQGGEKQLIDAVLSRQVPSGTLPIEVGAVVQNIGTAFAVYEAVQKNKPLFERVVTVTGKSVKTPKNLKVRVGTSINSIIEYCGGVPDDTVKIIGGGPMMGRALSNINAPITKGSSGVLLMGGEGVRRPQSVCIRCAGCVGACPMGLEPYIISQLSKLGKFNEAMEFAPFDCIECGSCSFTCPASIPLLDNIRIAKTEAMKILKNQTNKK